MYKTRELIENLDEFEAKLKRRGFKLEKTKIKSLYQAQKENKLAIEELKQKQKTLTKDYRENINKEEVKLQSNEIKNEIALLDKQLKSTETTLNAYLLTIPNIPSEKCPDGLDESHKLEIRRVGKIPIINNPKDHVELGKITEILDLKRAAKMSGSRFSILKGAGSKLQRSLINFLLDRHSESGFHELTVPEIVTRKTMTGTGQLPKFEKDLFKTSKNDNSELFLIPTGEVPLTNFYSDEIISENELPISLTSCTNCFRSEAGSYGKDTRGIIRQHQFSKIELVKFCTPESEWDEFKKLLDHVEKILQDLNLYYRVVNLPAGDIAFAAHLCYDLEVWIPSQNTFREISSCSLFQQFQARRCNIKYKSQVSKKSELVSTINGSALPIGRTIVAIMEQFQNSDGSINIPKKLQPYTTFSKILPSGKTQ